MKLVYRDIMNLPVNCVGITVCKSEITKYSITPIIRIKWDHEPSGYGENADNWIFLKISYVGSLKWKNISTIG
jgi:hypothetical protein